jgi:hypothetical protein
MVFLFFTQANFLRNLSYGFFFGNSSIRSNWYQNGEIFVRVVIFYTQKSSGSPLIKNKKQKIPTAAHAYHFAQ